MWLLIHAGIQANPYATVRLGWRHSVQSSQCCSWKFTCRGPLAIHKTLNPVHLTHWGPVTHICMSKLTTIGLDNGLSAGRRQAIIWTNAGILLIRPVGTNFSEILIKIQTFSLKNIRLKMSSMKCYPFRLSLNVIMWSQYICKHWFKISYWFQHSETWFCVVYHYEVIRSLAYIPLFLPLVLAS